MSLRKVWPEPDGQKFSAGRTVFSPFWICVGSQELVSPPDVSPRRQELALVWEMLLSHMPSQRFGLHRLLQRERRHSLSWPEHAEAPAGLSDWQRLNRDPVITGML